jgi:hypothetical protein
MPPGAGKSFYCSYLFPAWYLAGHHGASLIVASHTTNLAETWGRGVKNFTAENAKILDPSLAADSQAAGRWMLEGGSEYLAAGVGQAIVGFRANSAIIDDPVRGQEDADSETSPNKTWEWFQSDLKVEWFKHYTQVPPSHELMTYGARDYAMSAGKGDYTVHMAPGRQPLKPGSRA